MKAMFGQQRTELKLYLYGENSKFRIFAISFYRIAILIVALLSAACSNSREDVERESGSKKLELRYSQLETSYLRGNANRDSLKKIFAQLPNDSLKSNLLFGLSLFSYNEKDSTQFRYWNKNCFSTAYSQDDSLRLAEAHWDLANFYADHEVVDSSYFHFNRASQIYESLGEERRNGKMLLNMGILQKNIKDYTGSEIVTSKAISILPAEESLRDLYIGYNNLGILFNQLEEYQEAMKYHLKAEKLAIRLAEPSLKVNTWNNMGVVYENMGEYQNAVLKYEQGLKIDSIYHKKPQLYAMLLDNLAYSRFKAGNKSHVIDLFESALKIRDSIGHESGIVINKIHLGEFYLSYGDTIRSITLLEEARHLASEINNHRDWLASLLLLSKLKKAETDVLLSEYITLNDSLQKRERAVRNKFARIRFETNEFIAENQELTKKNNLIIGGSTGALVLSFLIIIVFRQKARNRKLQNEHDQQKANEDIYKLLLDQQNKIEEGKNKEKERVSKELHDGVLSEMYGIRFLLNNLNNKVDAGSIAARQKYLENLRVVEEEIRFISRDLQNKNLFEEVGFLKLLNQMTSSQEKQLGFLPILKNDVNIEWEYIDNTIKMNLYRIIQEATLNMKKYAQANKAEITFSLEEGNLVLSIVDNGKGFEISKKPRGIGIKNMQSRIKDVDGKIQFLSSEVGTKIQIEIPIK